MIKKILCATDGSEGAIKGARLAAEIAQKFEASVTVLAVGQIPVLTLFNYYPSMMEPEILPEQLETRIAEHGQTALQETRKVFEEAGIPCEARFELGHPADTICETATEGKFDLVVLGSRGLSGIKGMLMGSVTNKVAHQCNRPLLIVK